MYMSEIYAAELKERLPSLGESVAPPQIFINGEHIGGFEQVGKLLWHLEASGRCSAEKDSVHSAGLRWPPLANLTCSDNSVCPRLPAPLLSRSSSRMLCIRA